MVKSDVMNKDASLSIVWLCCPDLERAMGRRCKDSASPAQTTFAIQFKLKHSSLFFGFVAPVLLLKAKIFFLLLSQIQCMLERKQNKK